MTVPIPTLPAPSIPRADDGAVRKRRRRAPTGGAADDCFTCTKRNVKCDRRRPYCSQCLEIGNECSGYKTQLTWGVGVASRGKLRGLSLPVAKSPPVKSIKKGSSSRSSANPSLTGGQGHGHAPPTGHWNEQVELLSPRSAQSNIADAPLDHHHHLSPMPATPFHDYDFSKTSHAQPAPPLRAAPAHWHSLPFSASVPADGTRFPKMGPLLPHVAAETLSQSLDSLGDANYMSALSHTFSRDDLHLITSPTHLYTESYTDAHSPVPQPPISFVMMNHHQAPTSCPGHGYVSSEPNTSVHSHMDGFEVQLRNRLVESESLGETALFKSHIAFARFGGTNAQIPSNPRAGCVQHQPTF